MTKTNKFEDNFFNDLKLVQKNSNNLGLLFDQIDKVMEYIIDDFEIRVFVEAIDTLGGDPLTTIVSVALMSGDFDELLESLDNANELQEIDPLIIQNLKFIRAKYGAKFSKQIGLLQNDLKVDAVSNKIIISEDDIKLLETKLVLVNGEEIVTRNEFHHSLKVVRNIVDGLTLSNDELIFKPREKQLIAKQIKQLNESIKDLKKIFE
ncbi:hypothetical protein MOD69_19420 [Bacillus inaquosorum]|uniref:hypothetical protein n=1 Tax=Bacillus inaquosorum TaxID=483913 RepID=UPI00227DE484|nr:hypothetical protein [Bacillus inaquosorum]MCY8061613.1 hypothetical protein [Bacillus spizizenii]MCY8729450.1 hypothetical protein [Bacillus inaquosorum]